MRRSADRLNDLQQCAAANLIILQDCKGRTRVRESQYEREARRHVLMAGGKFAKWVSPGWAGVPDRIALFPGRRIIFVETKARDGVLSALQRKAHQWLKASGFEVVIVKDMHHARTFFK